MEDKGNAGRRGPVTSKNDIRITCKYGSKCYQKNPAHHKKYKHPPKRQAEQVGKQIVKKAKIDKEDKEDKEKKDKSEDSVAKKDKNEDSVAKKDKNEDSVDKKVEKDNGENSLCEAAEAEENPKIPVSIDNNEPELPASPEDVRESIKQKFLVEMPEDFYSFWSFCKSLSAEKPEEALKGVGLILVGPYDVLSGKLKDVKHRKLSNYLCHWRYYYDPPEFQTVIKGDDQEQYHMGYYRDDPKEMPCFVARNAAALDGSIYPMAENLFGAVSLYIHDLLLKSDPFKKVNIGKLHASLQRWAKDKNISLEVNSDKMKARNRKVVAKTFHKAGIVVPVNKQTDLGYRKLIETDAKLRNVLKLILDSQDDDERDSHLEKLQPIITATDIATDECDFGTGLELGLDLFTYGGEVFHGTILHLLSTAYSLLQREEFSKIIQAHLKNRRNGSNLSIV